MVKPSATSQNELASTAKPDDRQTRSLFTGTAIGMGWQLAVVVLLPILGGYKLDQMRGSMPAWTLVGMVVGLAASILVIRRALARMNNFNVEKHV